MRGFLSAIFPGLSPAAILFQTNWRISPDNKLAMRSQSGHSPPLAGIRANQVRATCSRAHISVVLLRTTLKPGSAVAAQVMYEVDDINQKRHRVHSY